MELIIEPEDVILTLDSFSDKQKYFSNLKFKKESKWNRLLPRLLFKIRKPPKKKKKLGPSQSYRVHTLLKTLLCDKLKKTGALKEVLVCNERDVCVLQAKPN